jgi:hypothetical protein
MTKLNAATFHVKQTQPTDYRPVAVYAGAANVEEFGRIRSGAASVEAAAATYRYRGVTPQNRSALLHDCTIAFPF